MNRSYFEELEDSVINIFDKNLDSIGDDLIFCSILDEVYKHIDLI